MRSSTPSSKGSSGSSSVNRRASLDVASSGRLDLSSLTRTEYERFCTEYGSGSGQKEDKVKSFGVALSSLNEMKPGAKERSSASCFV